MIRKIIGKLMNRETVSYLIFGVLTTLTDWATYELMREANIDYKIATIVSWIAAVLVAYVTNKIFVFESFNFHLNYLTREFSSFVACRALTGLFTLAAMMFLVGFLGITQDFICKVVVSAISLLLNYVFSKMFIFKKKTTS